jgi:hypothetical protein
MSNHRGLIQSRETPIEGALSRLETMPFRPIARACRTDPDVRVAPVSRPLDRQAAWPAPASPEPLGGRAGPLDAIVLPEIGAPSAIA